jgi:hypothetical protein
LVLISWMLAVSVKATSRRPRTSLADEGVQIESTRAPEERLQQEHPHHQQHHG